MHSFKVATLSLCAAVSMNDYINVSHRKLDGTVGITNCDFIYRRLMTNCRLSRHFGASYTQGIGRMTLKGTSQSTLSPPSNDLFCDKLRPYRSRMMTPMGSISNSKWKKVGDNIDLNGWLLASPSTSVLGFELLEQGLFSNLWVAKVRVVDTARDIRVCVIELPPISAA